jgi:hypothetical protein
LGLPLNRGQCPYGGKTGGTFTVRAPAGQIATGKSSAESPLRQSFLILAQIPVKKRFSRQYVFLSSGARSESCASKWYVLPQDKWHNQIAGADAAFTYRYDGLRPLLHSGGHWFLLPAGWTHGNGATVIILPDTAPSIRVDLAP